MTGTKSLTAIGVVPTPADSLHAELRALITSSRQRLAGAVNSELTRLYWTVGQRLHTEVLGDARASYGTQLLDQLGRQLANEFGRGFESRNLRRMVKFAEAFSDAAIVSTLSAKLSWSHMVAIVALKSPDARQFYVQHAAQDGWSVRELNHQIERKAFERTELASMQAPTSIECDHQRFGGFLKASLEELLIALNDDRHLLHDPDGLFAQSAPLAGAAPQGLYPQGFSAQKLIQVVEAQAVWEGV